MDGVGHDQGGVLVLGATNVPWELDPAMRRRFEKRVYIALPDPEARTHMFKLNLGDTPNDLTDDDFRMLGDSSEGYSGSDVAVVVREALMEPLRKCKVARQYIVRPDGKYVPCEEYPNCPHCPMALSTNPGGIDAAKGQRCNQCGAIRIGLYDVPSEALEVPPIIFNDFTKALSRAHSSVGADELDRFVEWTSEFGQDG